MKFGELQQGFLDDAIDGKSETFGGIADFFFKNKCYRTYQRNLLSELGERNNLIANVLRKTLVQ